MELRLLPLLGEWSFGGQEVLATKDTKVHKEKCAAYADCSKLTIKKGGALA